MIDPNVLIVDDEAANVALLEAILHRAGYVSVRGTTDSRQVSRLVSEAGPDLILLDLSMPFIDGYTVLEQLRASQPEGTFLPVVILTADVTPQARRRALAAGANDFLTKPFDNDEVLLRCKNLLAARTLHLALQNQNAVLEEKVRQRTSDLEATLAELRATQQRQVHQERLRALGEMSSGVAQDFNNQLTVLIGYSDLLLLNNAQMVGNRPMAVRYLQTLRTAAQESAKIVGRLKEFSRRREADDVFLPINLPKLVRETAELTQPKWRSQARADGRQITIQLELEPVADVPGNAAELRETVSHLIFNAVDAMPEGGTITLRTLPNECGAVILEVADTGIGMSDDIRRRCLDPFFTTKDHAPGTGMGLSTVHGIVRRHEGELEIITQPGNGTTMRVRLPVHGTAGSAGTTPDARQRPGRSLRVLLVEDDPMVREVVSEYLRRDEHEVSTAVTGREGLEKFEAGAFDLVVTDLALEGLNGEHLAAAVKQRAAATPVILLTGFGDKLLAEGGKPDNIDAVLCKPLAPAELWRAMARVMPADTPLPS